MDYGKQTRRNIFLPDTLVSDLKVIASRRDISYSELIRQVLTAYMRQVSKKERPFNAKR